MELLLADIGGTNARFALASETAIGPALSLQVADFARPESALREFLARTPQAGRLRRAALAVAGPVIGRRAKLTNGDWHFDATALAENFGLDRLDLVNDFEAVAWAVPRLEESDLMALGGGPGDLAEPIAVIGPGTGLGVAAYLPASPSRRDRVLVSEGGHSTMAVSSDREARILDYLRQRFGHVSAERLLSGDGLVNLYETASIIDGMPAPRREPAEIVERAEAGDCNASRAAFETFCALLGTFAGNIALILGARGGVYLAGGILPRFPKQLAASSFRERFEDKGRLRDHLEAIPTKLILRSDPAFLGLWHLARQN